MPWVELRAITNADHANTLSTQLSELGALAVTFEDAGDQPIFEPTPETPRLWQQTIVVGLFDQEHPLEAAIQFLEEQEALGIIKNFHSKEIADENWERRCLDQFQPIHIRGRLWICPSWHEPKDPEAVNVILDPGLAFGTGSHPTTQLCLAWLEEYVKPQWTVIDYGCGSGILGIAAQKLGAGQIIAVDNDPQALLATQMNAERNHLQSDAILTQLPDKPITHKADLVVANILAQPLIELAAYFKTLLKPGGQLVLSGILKEQVEQVLDAYRPYFQMYLPNYQGEWSILTGFHSEP